MIFTAILLLHAIVSAAFLAPASTIIERPRTDLMHNRCEDDAINIIGPRKRREFFVQSLGSIFITSSFVTFPEIVRAGDDYIYKRSEGADLTSQLFNPDGSLRDPNSVVTAQENAVDVIFSVPSNDSIDNNNNDNPINIIISTDGTSPISSWATTRTTNIKISYKIPLKWNRDASSTLPLYYDSSEGKNGKSCNRITVYSVATSSNNLLDMMVLEKASQVGVAKSLFMDRIPNNYFDQGVLKADLISGRTVRKPIQSIDGKGGTDEQLYYEFDLAFAPLKCDGFMEGNKENLGLGFCPYDNIYLISATVVKSRDDKGMLICCVVECNKDEWKIANSDLKRVRSSFVLDRV